MALPSYVRLEPAARAGDAAPEVSVVIPAYNEENRCVPYLEKIAAWFDGRGESYEILVANDGSRDHTADVIREQMKKLPALGLVHYDQNRGKGHAVRMGMLAARGRLRLFADADGSTPIEELARVRKPLDAGAAQIAVGSRALSSPEVQREIRPHRYVIGQVFRWVRSVLLRVKVVDSQCGFKLFSKDAADAIFPVAKIDGFAFDVELLYLAGRMELPIAEVPVNWRDDDASRVNLLLDPIKMVLDMLRVRRLHRDLAVPAKTAKGG